MTKYQQLKAALLEHAQHLEDLANGGGATPELEEQFRLIASEEREIANREYTT